MNKKSTVSFTIKNICTITITLFLLSCGSESPQIRASDDQIAVIADTLAPITLYYPEVEDSYLLLNLRAGAGEEYPKVGAVEPGDTVKVVGRSSDSFWLLTRTGGWVVTRNIKVHCTPQFDASTLPVVGEVRSRAPVTVRDKAKGIDSLFALMASDGMFNGCVIAVINDTVVLEEAVGYANFRARRPLSLTTAFELASVSKQFTAMAIMMLQEQGRLDYDDRITKFFPDFPAYGKDITIRNLLNHTSGLVCYTNEYRLSDEQRQVQDPMTILKAQKELNFKPGEKYRYSNSGYWLLGRIIEQVSGLPYSAFMREHIFKPLGMEHSYALGDPRLADADLAFSIIPDEYSEIDPRLCNTYSYPETGAHGVLSCVVDLYTYDQALRTNRLVKQSTLQEAFTPPKLRGGNKSNYGFGWNVRKESDGSIAVGHGGLNHGFQTWFGRRVESNTTLIILSNYYVLNGFEALLSGVDNILDRGSFQLPVGLISNKLFKQIMDHGVTNLQYVYDSLKVNHSTDYAFSELLLNHATKLFGDRDCFEQATAVANVTVKEYPSSPLAYWVLGDIYRKTGDKLKAVECLKKSLELNPGFEPAQTLLRSLEGAAGSTVR